MHDSKQFLFEKMVEKWSKKSAKKVCFSCEKGNFFVFDFYYPFYYPGSKRITDKRIMNSKMPPDIRGKRISGEYPGHLYSLPIACVLNAIANTIGFF